MTEQFIDQTITAISTLYWIDDRSQDDYLLALIAAIDCVTEDSDY